jgi:hypothetical protein
MAAAGRRTSAVGAGGGQAGASAGGGSSLGGQDFESIAAKLSDPSFGEFPEVAKVRERRDGQTAD